MNLNTNLWDDNFLFPEDMKNKNERSQSSGTIVRALNKRGIQTVEDLLNYDQTKFNRLNSHYLGALIQILRYKYLGEELINDVLLESSYSFKDQKQLSKDLKRLGFGRKNQELERLVFNFFNTLEKDVVTMEEILRSDNPFIKEISLLGNADFKSFYLEYIDKKKLKEENNSFVKSNLEELKLELERLIKIRDMIDNKIQDLQKEYRSKPYGK